MASSAFNAPRGMRDFYPEDMRKRTRVFDAWRHAAESFGFEAYDTCVVESLPLLVRKAGEEIVEQIYHFKDKSGRDLALRPEITPSLARMVAARQGALSFPLKWYTVGQCFRYERMTRGRKREHYQWNLDIVGEPSVIAEAEVLATAAKAMEDLGLGRNDYAIHYSSRALLGALLGQLGIPPEHHQAAFLALDKRGKIPDTAMSDLLTSGGIQPEGIPAILQLLEIQSLDDAAKLLPPESEAVRDVMAFLDHADAYGFRSLLSFDIGVIRGLSYYTGIVFEAFDTKRELRAIFGGGRYDGLLASIGGNAMTAVGLGFGDVVIAELLDLKQAAATAGSTRSICHVGFMALEQQSVAIQVAAALRRQGASVNLLLTPVKARTFFSKANAAEARQAVLIGADDLAANTIRLKNLADRSEQVLPLQDLLE